MKIPMPPITPPPKRQVYIVRIVKCDKDGMEIPNSEEYWICDGVNTTAVIDKFNSREDAIKYILNSKTLELV